MSRRLIATIVAAALAISSVNVGTAQAGERDAVKFIVGATALAIIGSALAAEQRKNRVVTPNYQGSRYDRDGYRHNPKDGYQPHRGGGKGHYKGHRQSNFIPRACLVNVRSARGWTQGYAVRCTQNNTRANLPSNCVRRNLAQGPRMFYSPHCLRRNGFNA